MGKNVSQQQTQLILIRDTEDLINVEMAQEVPKLLMFTKQTVQVSVQGIT